MQYLKDDIERLIYQHIGGTITQGDDRLLTEVLLHDEQMRRFYESIAARFDHGRGKDLLNVVNTEAAWEKVSGQVKVKKLRSTTKRLLPYAAMLFLALGFAFYFYPQRPVLQKMAKAKPAKPGQKQIQLVLSSGKTLDLSQEQQSIRTEDAEINAGKKSMHYAAATGGNELRFNTLTIPETFTYQITLSDGTQVWLNSASTLRFPFRFAAGKREVYVSGEAYFKVAKNAKRPFIVHTPATDVQVLGTAFNINTYDAGKVRTSLVEGRVRTTAGSTGIDLSPGNEALFTSGNFEKHPFDQQDILGWMQGQYYFHDAQLNSLVPVIKRWYNMDLVFSSSKSAEHKMSGVIEKDQPIAQFLENLSAILQVHASVKGNRIYIR